jgi:hypothetical protein
MAAMPVSEANAALLLQAVAVSAPAGDLPAVLEMCGHVMQRGGGLPALLASNDGVEQACLQLERALHAAADALPVGAAEKLAGAFR